jgi:hypothetical protein
VSFNFKRIGALSLSAVASANVLLEPNIHRVLQQKEMQILTAQLKEQAAQIQKVSAQLEASKPAPKVVANK